MNSCRSRIALAVVLAAVVVPACTSMAATRKVILSTTPLVSVIDVFGTGSVYDNWVTQLHDAIGAEADIMVDQPATQRSVTISLSAANLIPGKSYKASLAVNGYTLNGQGGVINCTLAGYFVAGSDGTADFTWDSSTLFPKAHYTCAVFVNYYDYPLTPAEDGYDGHNYSWKVWNKSILVSAESFEFDIK